MYEPRSELEKKVMSEMKPEDVKKMSRMQLIVKKYSRKKKGKMFTDKDGIQGLGMEE